MYSRVGARLLIICMSDSSSDYQNLDHARMEISMTMFGQLFRVKGFNALLGGVSLMFLKE